MSSKIQCCKQNGYDDKLATNAKRSKLSGQAGEGARPRTYLAGGYSVLVFSELSVSAMVMSWKSSGRLWASSTDRPNRADS